MLSVFGEGSNLTHCGGYSLGPEGHPQYNGTQLFPAERLDSNDWPPLFNRNRSCALNVLAPKLLAKIVLTACKALVLLVGAMEV
jgi:hypothetical protein